MDGFENVRSNKPLTAVVFLSGRAGIGHRLGGSDRETAAGEKNIGRLKENGKHGGFPMTGETARHLNISCVPAAEIPHGAADAVDVVADAVSR